MRFGSNGGRPGWRPKAEALYSVDVRRWVRDGLPSHDGFFAGPLDIGGSSDRRIGVTVDHERLEVFEWRCDRRYSVHLTRTSCYFGGYRSWFRCPYCTRRAAKLYLGSSGFACRRCYNLAYRSQSLAPDDRAVAQAAKIRRALGGPEGILDDFPEKPRGMHWRTYDRLCERCMGYEVPALEAMQGLLAQLWQLRRRRPAHR